MGDVKRILSQCSLPNDRAYGKRLAVDIAENIHLHYRDMRLEFSLSEWHSFVDFIRMANRDVVMANVDSGWKEGSHDFHAQRRKSIDLWSKYGGGWKEDGYDPKRLKVELQRNGMVHLHYHDLRIEMDFDRFKEFCKLLDNSHQNWICGLLDVEHYNRTKSKYERLNVSDVMLDDLVSQVWVLEGKQVTCDLRPLAKSEIYRAVSFLSNDPNKSKEIYSKYMEVIQRRGRKNRSRTFDELKSLYNSVESDGYKKDCLIEVLYMDEKMIIVDGQHRAAILSYLGKKEIPVVCSVKR